MAASPHVPCQYAASVFRACRRAHVVHQLVRRGSGGRRMDGARALHAAGLTSPELVGLADEAAVAAVLAAAAEQIAV